MNIHYWILHSFFTVVNYTVFIDNSMTQQGIQERILAEDGSYTVAGDKKVIKGYEIPQCSNNYTVVIQVISMY